MPTYAYRCRACGHEFELFQSIMDEPEKRCPTCEQETAERVLSGGSGLIFKGSGFYITDYKNQKSNETKPKIDTTKTTEK